MLATELDVRRRHTKASTNLGGERRTLPKVARLSVKGRQVTAYYAVLAPPTNTSLLVIGHIFLSISLSGSHG